MDDGQRPCQCLRVLVRGCKDALLSLPLTDHLRLSMPLSTGEANGQCPCQCLSVLVKGVQRYAAVAAPYPAPEVVNVIGQWLGFATLHGVNVCGEWVQGLQRLEVQGVKVRGPGLRVCRGQRRQFLRIVHGLQHIYIYVVCFLCIVM